MGPILFIAEFFWCLLRVRIFNLCGKNLPCLLQVCDPKTLVCVSFFDFWCMAHTNEAWDAIFFCCTGLMVWDHGSCIPNKTTWIEGAGAKDILYTKLWAFWFKNKVFNISYFICFWNWVNVYIPLHLQQIKFWMDFQSMYLRFLGPRTFHALTEETLIFCLWVRHKLQLRER